MRAAPAPSNLELNAGAQKFNHVATPDTVETTSQTPAAAQTIVSIMMPSAAGLRASISSPKSMLSTVMASPPQVLIGMYLVIGLDDIGLLALCLGLLGISSIGSFRERFGGSKVPKGKCSASFEESAKVPKDIPCTASNPPNGFLVGCAVLLGVWRLVGPTLNILDTPLVVDGFFVILIACAYSLPFKSATKHAKKTRSQTVQTVTREPVNIEKPLKSKPPSAGRKNPKSTAPVAPGLAGEIERFVTNALPREQDNALLRRLSNKAKGCIRGVVPEAEVTTVAYVNLRAEASEGEVHDADCHMVVTCDPEILAARLKEYFLKPEARRRKSTEKLSGPDLRKCALKAFTQRLHFMIFWRSQVSGLDPMVVYIVPDNISNVPTRIRLHFMVNCHYHLRLAAVVSEESTRTKELVLFLVEWAKRRALVNVTKGHAHPYAWCLMALYFLRFEAQKVNTKSLIDTIRDFVKYLMHSLNSDGGPLLMRFTPGSTVASADVTTPVPYIEDLKDSTQNVAWTLTADGLARVREELARADTILSKEGAKLSELMERHCGPVAPSSDSQ